MNATKYHAALNNPVCGPDKQLNKARGICISCKQPARERCYSAAGRREFRFSGLCEVCFDELAAVEEQQA